MMNGILWAEVQDGDYKGWPLGATMAVGKGLSTEVVREKMLGMVAEERARLDTVEAYLRGLLNPGPEAERALQEETARLAAASPTPEV